MLTINNMKKKPHVVIFSGYGLNTEDETKAALESVVTRREFGAWFLDLL